MIEKFALTIGKLTLIFIVGGLFNLVWAFPVMWAWNYAVTATFGLPALTWGKAWCLTWLSNVLLKSILIESEKS